MVKIQSGDPGRGALSLEMEEPILAGQHVQVSCGVNGRSDDSSCTGEENIYSPNQQLDD